MIDLMDRSELVYIALGSNVGSARTAMTDAVARLRSLPDPSLEGVSRLYRTRPVGPVAQDDFLNAVVAIRVAAAPEPAEAAMALLDTLKGIERSMGRRERERWGPREIDLDLLLFGAHRLRVQRAAATRSRDPARPGGRWLEVPHPAAQARFFVLAPLADLAPDLVPPGWTMSVTSACRRAVAVEGADAVTAIGTWDAAHADWTDRGISGGSGGAR